jgi:hypothetical protein
LQAHRSTRRLVLPTARVADWSTQLVVRAQVPKDRRSRGGGEHDAPKVPGGVPRQLARVLKNTGQQSSRRDKRVELWARVPRDAQKHEQALGLSAKT